MTRRSAQSGLEPEAIEALASVPWEGRAILLVDLDAFFASVEQLDHPGWRGKPVIVGGDAGRRGVVSTASYEARAFGVHSAMPSSTARKLCPDAIWTQGRYERYREMSRKVMAVLFDETPHVQQVSIDEAFLDVSPTKVNREHPVLVAQRIQSRVEQLGITCSIGVGTTKAVAKMASDMDKPQGLTVVMPGSEASFLSPLPVRDLSGIGPAAERALKSHGIETLGDLASCDDEFVQRLLGKNGAVMLLRARGLPDGEVVPDDTVKSVSCETSFAHDFTERADIEAAIATMAAKVGRRLRRKGLAGRTLTLKMRYADLSTRSAQCQLGSPTDDEFSISAPLADLLDQLWSPGMAVRLVGVAISGFDEDEHESQLSLFEDDEPADHTPDALRGLLGAADKVKERFGEGALRYGRELRLRGTDTGSSSKNPSDYR